MKTRKELTDDQKNGLIEDFKANFCPFGYLDIQRAVTVANEVNIDPDELFNIIEEFKTSCGYDSFDDIDPVYCIYDHILQMARNEIDKLYNFDFVNDGAEVTTYGNYMCTEYDNTDNAEKIKEILKENKCIIEDLEDCTQWFLSEIEISQEDLI
jgi:superfamily II helicase